MINAELDHLKSYEGDATLMLDMGGEKKLTVEDLRDMPTPDATDTFQPIPHYDFVQNLQDPADKILGMSGFALDDVMLAVHGNQCERLFGAFVYRNGREDMRLAIGFRTANDKSMSAGIALGGRVTVCSNLMFSGKETLMRKHTKNIKEDLRSKVLSALWDVDTQWSDLQRDVDAMTEVTLSDRNAYRTFGEAFGNKILAAQQMTKAVQEWRNPSFDHGDKTLWRWYNAVTETYKGLNPMSVMKKHRQLHEFTMDAYQLN